MNKIPESLIKEFSEIVARGNENEAREFLIKNIKEFPEDVQQEIISSFVEEALFQKRNDLHSMENFKKEGLNGIEELEKGKSKLEAKLRILDIKNNI